MKDRQTDSELMILVPTFTSVSFLRTCSPHPISLLSLFFRHKVGGHSCPRYLFFSLTSVSDIRSHTAPPLLQDPDVHTPASQRQQFDFGHSAAPVFSRFSLFASPPPPPFFAFRGLLQSLESPKKILPTHTRVFCLQTSARCGDGSRAEASDVEGVSLAYTA